jgi:hypothetical protein
MINIDNILESRSVTVSTNGAHKATVTVGKDVIEAEYHTYERVDLLGINEPKWTLWDKITTPFWKIKRWFKDTYWEVRYGFQRMFKGYDSVDTFETFAKFRERYIKILTDYRKYHVGYCGEMTEEEWKAVMNKIAECFEFWSKDLPTPAYEAFHKAVVRTEEKGCITVEAPDELFQAWRAEEWANFELKMQKLKEGFDLLYKYYPHLWD